MQNTGRISTEPVDATVVLSVEFLPHGRQATLLPQVHSTVQVHFLPDYATCSWVVHRPPVE